MNELLCRDEDYSLLTSPSHQLTIFVVCDVHCVLLSNSTGTKTSFKCELLMQINEERKTITFINTDGWNTLAINTAVRCDGDSV